MQMLKPGQTLLEHEEKDAGGDGGCQRRKRLKQRTKNKHTMQNDALAIHYSLGFCSPSKQ